MPGLLDYVKGYTHGGSVDFDPYANTSQADMLSKLGIIVSDDAMGLLPTFDPVGADMAREAFSLRTAGLSDTLATARRGGTSSLFDLYQQSEQKTAGRGFAGEGAGTQAVSKVRSGIISNFGDIASDVGRREDQAYLDLQQDIFGMQQGYESDLVSAIGDLDPDDWRFGNAASEGVHENCNEQCGGFAFGGQQYNDCIDACYSGGTGGDTGGDTGIQCPPGYSYVNGGCQRDQV